LGRIYVWEDATIQEIFVMRVISAKP
jgi:hypothetical protein